MILVEFYLNFDRDLGFIIIVGRILVGVIRFFQRFY